MDKSYLKKICESESYTDCSFKFPNEEGKVIKGHRVILSNVPSFCELFENSESQSNEGYVIEIKDVKSMVFKNFIRYI